LRVESPLSPYECSCSWWHLTKGTPEKPIEASDASQHDVELVSALPANALREIVVRDASGEGDPSQRAALRHYRNQVRWKRQLGQLIADIETQLKDRRGDTTLAGHDWTKRATGYRDALLVRLNECKRLRASDHAAMSVGQKQRQRDALVAAESGATVKELRAAAGEIAIQRLIEAHDGEFCTYLAEEYARIGLSLPERVAARLPERAA
jgi:hypothetical protein